MQGVMNVWIIKYHFWGGRFHILPRYYKTSPGRFLNNFHQVWLISNQRDHVTLFRYVNWDDDVSHLVRGRRLLGNMKYLMRSVKQESEAVGIWNEDD